jgi:hypothetical protein
MIAVNQPVALLSLWSMNAPSTLRALQANDTRYAFSPSAGMQPARVKH